MKKICVLILSILMVQTNIAFASDGKDKTMTRTDI